MYDTESTLHHYKTSLFLGKWAKIIEIRIIHVWKYTPSLQQDLYLLEKWAEITESYMYDSTLNHYKTSVCRRRG